MHVHTHVRTFALVFGQERDALGNLRDLAEALGMPREQSGRLRDERDAVNQLKPLFEGKCSKPSLKCL